MKIAIITSGYMPVPATKGGAVETLIENIIYYKEKNKDDNKIYIFTDYDKSAEEKSKEYTESNFNWIKTPKIINLVDLIIFNFFSRVLKKKKNISYRYIFKRLYYINKVSLNLKKNNYDKIIIENNVSLFKVLQLRKNYIKYRGKYYLHLHNEILQTFGNIKLIENSKKIIGISKYINDTAKKRIINLKDSQMEVLKNCIDIERVNSDFTLKKSIIDKTQFEKDDIKIIFVGRLSEEKGIKELIKAIINLRNPKIKLIIVGNSFYKTKVISPFEKNLRNMIDTIKENVIFTGYIEHKRIYEIYDMADIVVLPSIWQEPAGLTIIEAAAVGVPLITTDVGGIKEYVDEKSAIIIQNDKNIVNNIEKAINEIINNENLKENLKESARNIREEYSIEKYYKKFIKILEAK